MKRILSVFFILATIGAGAFSGLISALLFGLTDLVFRLAPQTASGDIIIVAIDRRSLDTLGPWPWPRRYHAAVLARLDANGARRIALDIDVSGRTNATDDQALADAIGQTTGDVILPVFKLTGTNSERSHISPYAPFQLGAELGTANVTLTKNGQSRRYRSGDDWNGKIIPSLASLLAGDTVTRERSFFLDYGIQPESIPRISYIDILNGTFQPDAINRKTVIIGAMDADLGDQLRVPVHGVLSGPVVHALAFESLVQGRNIYGGIVVFLLLISFLAFFFSSKFLGKLPGRAEPGRAS